jgi:hypothetical protein
MHAAGHCSMQIVTGLQPSAPLTAGCSDVAHRLSSFGGATIISGAHCACSALILYSMQLLLSPVGPMGCNVTYWYWDSNHGTSWLHNKACNPTSSSFVSLACAAMASAAGTLRLYGLYSCLQCILSTPTLEAAQGNKLGHQHYHSSAAAHAVQPRTVPG